MKVPNSVDAPSPNPKMPEAATDINRDLGSNSGIGNNVFPFTDMPNDDAIDRATEANHDVDFASVGPEHNFPRQPALESHALPNPLT